MWDPERSFRMDTRLIALLVAAGLGLGCVLVDNPSYLALGLDEADSTGEAESSGAESSTDTDASETETASGSETTSASETADECPSGTLGCPCELGEFCEASLTCLEGVCALPSSCPSEDAGVLVDLALGNDVDPDTQLGICSVDLMVEGVTLIGAANCLLGVADFGFAIAPFIEAEQPTDIVGGNQVTALVRVNSSQDVFVHLVFESGVELWLVDASTLDSGDAEVTNYPVPLAPAGSDCPAIPEPCGASQRRAIQARDALVFDGSLAGLSPTLRLWVDEARSVCGVDRFRFALIRY